MEDLMLDPLLDDRSIEETTAQWTEEEWLRYLARLDVTGLNLCEAMKVATHPHTHPDVLETLSLRHEEPLQHALLRHPRVTPRLVCALWVEAALADEEKRQSNVWMNQKKRKDEADEKKSKAWADALLQNPTLCFLMLDPQAFIDWWGPINPQAFINWYESRHNTSWYYAPAQWLKDSWKRKPEIPGITEIPECPPSFLSSFAYSQDVRIRIHVAAHRNTPDSTLAQLSCDQEVSVRLQLAQRTHLTHEMRKRLAADRHTKVCLRFLDRTDVTQDDLRFMARNPNFTVRRAIGCHPLASVEFILQCANDRDAVVRLVAADAPRLPLPTLEILATDRHPLVRWAIAERRDTPTAQLAYLAQDRDASVRQAVAANPAIPLMLWKRLSVDHDVRVRQLAWEHPDHPKGRMWRRWWPRWFCRWWDAWDSRRAGSKNESIGLHPSLPTS